MRGGREGAVGPSIISNSLHPLRSPSELPLRLAKLFSGRRYRSITRGSAYFAVVDAIGSLTVRDFDKSMPSEISPAIWQDVYKPVSEGRELYVKFTLDAQRQLLLISFKDNEP
jgi:hypothetical protein